MKSGKIVLGVLAGITAGAVLGILFAPDKGVKTRKKIMGKQEDIADALKDKFDELVNSITQKLEQANQGADELALKGKAKLDGLKKDIHHATS
jgi:gas vesicle protein